MKKYVLDKQDSVLVIVDIQEKLADAMSEKRKVTESCLHLLEATSLLDIPVVITEQYPKGLGSTIPDLKEALSEYSPIEKLSFDCCREQQFTGKIDELNKKQVILAGMETHICVLQTCLGLLENGYAVHVVDDAVSSRSRDNYNTAISYMRDAGAVITCTETVLFQWLEKAGSQEFRAISKRIK